MIDIFTYTNYRTFLKDFFVAEKAKNPHFSYQSFANKAGFSSKSFIPHVIEGKKNLSKDSIHKVGKALKLEEKSFSYFETLVAFTQATTLDQKNFYYNKLLQFNRRNVSKVLQKNQYDFYNHWYHNTIRELVTLYDFQGDYTKLASMVRPAITPKQARQSVLLLLKLNLIKKEGNRYVQTDPSITTGDEVRDLAIQNFHIQNLVMTADAVTTCPPEERDVSVMVLGLSQKGFKLAKEALQQFRKTLAAIAENDEPAQRVYHVNMQLIPTTNAKKAEQL